MRYMTDPNELEKLIDLVKSFDQAMFVTRAKTGELRSRPMQIVATKPDGSMVFVTGLHTEKVDEIRGDHDVNVAMQDGKRFVSISGKATVDNDRDRIGLYHDKSWDIWFPEGKDDPNIALIDLAPEMAEYWDGSGWNQAKYAIAAARALLSDEKIDSEAMEHQTIPLKGAR